MGDSAIEWTQKTWNPVTGCTKVSPGCKNCYAETLTRRLTAMGQAKYANGFALTVHDGSLAEPLRWRKPQLVFVNSMSDLFHEDVPVDFIQRTLDVMRQAHWHRFQILTKRSERVYFLDDDIDWPSNIWMGVSVEDNDHLFRIDHLRATTAKVKFLSLEPLLGPLPDLSLDGIDWVIVGGESGPGARPIAESWVTDIRDLCVAQDVPFFFKQWGGVNKKKKGRDLEGRVWDEMPEWDA